MRRVVALVVVVAATTAWLGPWRRADGPVAAAAPATVRHIAPAPRRILLVGDSLMGEVAAAVEAATSGRAQVDYVLTIGTANVSDDWWDVWAPVVERDHPDAVAVLVGPWELDRPDFGTPAWSAWYGARLDAWADLLTAGGAALHWVLPPSVRDAEAAARMDVVRDAFRQLAARRSGTTIVDSDLALGAPVGTFVERAASGPRLRRIDGLHLCPAGAARIAERLLGAMVARPPRSGWENGPWTTAEPAYSPVECPA